ncbi:MAG: hypothetical protein ACRCUI_05690, partial [Polymorphobacter sp.]
LVDDARDFQRLRGTGPGFDGFYTATPNTIAAFVDRSRPAQLARAQSVLFHEYAHHFLFAHRHGSYPAWYVEGLASYWETARFAGGRASYGNYDTGRAQLLSLRSWMPMALVLGADWQALPTNEMPMFYAQSWLAVHYLNSDPVRADALQRYLAAVTAGAASAPAFAEAFGYPVERFDKVLIDHMMSQAVVATKRPFTLDKRGITTAPLSAIADQLLLPAAMLDIGVEAAQVRPLLEQTRRIAARFPDDRSAQIVRATAEIRIGDRAQGRALVEALLQATPDSPMLLTLLGTAQLIDHQPAAQTLALADAGRPDDYRILFLRALAQPRPFDAAARSLLMRANALAPMVEEIALAAAQAQADAGDFTAARTLLEPVANNPHGGAAAAQARRWLGQLPRQYEPKATLDGANVAPAPAK